MLQATKPQTRPIRSAVIGLELEGDMRSVSIVAHLLHGVTSSAAPIDGDDHDAVCWLVAELMRMGHRLDKGFDELFEAAKGVRS